MVRQLIRHGKHAIQEKKSDKWKNPCRTLTLVRKTVFTKHGGTWNSMLESQRNKFREEAISHQASQVQAHLEKRQDIWHKIAQHRSAMQHGLRDDGECIRMSHARLSHADLARVEGIWDSIDRSQYIVPENAYEVRYSPVQVQKIIEQAPCPPVSHFKPFWAGMLSWARPHHEFHHQDHHG